MWQHTIISPCGLAYQWGFFLWCDGASVHVLFVVTCLQRLWEKIEGHWAFFVERLFIFMVMWLTVYVFLMISTCPKLTWLPKLLSWSLSGLKMCLTRLCSLCIALAPYCDTLRVGKGGQDPLLPWKLAFESPRITCTMVYYVLSSRNIIFWCAILIYDFTLSIGMWCGCKCLPTFPIKIRHE